MPATTQSAERGQRLTKPTCGKCGEEVTVRVLTTAYNGRYCLSCAKEDNERNNSRGNAISRLAYQIAGSSSRKFYALTKEERLAIRDTARRLYDLGADVGIAASAELTTREGFVYLITNRAWPTHVKVGRAFDPESRLNGYQTGSPFRDYELRHAVYFPDCYTAEREMHARFADSRVEGEWYSVSVDQAIHSINKLRETI